MRRSRRDDAHAFESCRCDGYAHSKPREGAYLLTGMSDRRGERVTNEVPNSKLRAAKPVSKLKTKMQRRELRTWEISTTRRAASHQERGGTCCAVDSACARVPGLCGTAELEEARRMAERETWTYSMRDGLSGELAASGKYSERGCRESRVERKDEQDAVVSRTLELLYTPTSGQPSPGSRVRRARVGTRASQTASDKQPSGSGSGTPAAHPDDLDVQWLTQIHMSPCAAPVLRHRTYASLSQPEPDTTSDGVG